MRLPGWDPLRRPHPALVVFASAHDAARSQMALAFFDHVADPGRARGISAGTRTLRDLDQVVVRAMAEVGVPLPAVKPRRFSNPLAMASRHLVTLGCADDLPFFPRVSTEDWPIDDPTDQPARRVKEIRDEIRRRVAAFVHARRWERGPGGG